jgi:hypothetical protein
MMKKEIKRSVTTVIRQTSEDHLEVYARKSVLHVGNTILTFQEGAQSESTKMRYRRICDAFESGFLLKTLQDVQSGKIDLSSVADADAELLKKIVEGVSENEGRAVVCICFLQLAIKSIEPAQSIRLHKGGGKGFSWVEGISMRSLDSKYTSKFLRDNHLMSMNSFGAMMTRSFAENYPYSGLYKASIKGPAASWLRLVDSVELGNTNPSLALAYMMVLLKNRSDEFNILSDRASSLAKTCKVLSFDEVREGMLNFVDHTTNSARALEVVMHGLMQALQGLGAIEDNQVSPLCQMRTANKKAGSVGDIEIKNFEGEVVEAWDAKYGKPYLWDELAELGEKLENAPSVTKAGFVVDKKPDIRADILDRKREIEQATKASVYLMSFDEWARFQCGNVAKKDRAELANSWLVAVAESFGRKRLQLAPIDEPCEKWLKDLISWLEKITAGK